MYEKLEKLREDLKRAETKRDQAIEKVKRAEERLRLAEREQFMADVTALHMTPEQFGAFLKLATEEKLNMELTGMVERKVTTALEEVDERNESEDMYGED